MESVLIAGGAGLVGQRLHSTLKEKGLMPMILTRNKSLATRRDDHFFWDTENGIIDQAVLQADYIVNLAGAGIASKKWTIKRKQNIIKSRTDSTRFLVESFAANTHKIKAFINASAMGIYGDAADKVLKESDKPVTKDFLVEVCELWEESARQATRVAESVSVLRISTVLSTKGGAFPKLTLPMKLGLSNYFGSGNQYFSWIHIDDLCDMIIHCLDLHHTFEVFNAASPNPITNKNFVKSLRHLINGKSILIPVPALALKLGMGEMSSILLNSTRLGVKKIMDTGFEFEFDTLTKAVNDLMESKH